MIKLSVFTDEISQDPLRAAKVAREFNLTGVEIRSVWDTQPQDLSDTQIADLKNILDDHGLAVSAVASPFLKCDIFNKYSYQQHFDILRRCIALGQALDTKIIRGFTFWKTENTPKVWAEVERVYQDTLPILEAEDAVIGIENEHDTTAATARLTAQLLAKLDSPRVRAIWDTANEVFAEDGERPFPEAYSHLRPYVVHIHIKDAFRNLQGKPQVALVGEGEVDFASQFQALKDEGYTGYLSLETHWRQIDLPADLLKTPGGEAFSEAGEEATRRCLAAITSLLKR